MIVFAIEDKKVIFMKFYAHQTLQIMQNYEKKKARASLTDKFSVVITKFHSCLVEDQIKANFFTNYKNIISMNEKKWDNFNVVYNIYNIVSNT